MFHYPWGYPRIWYPPPYPPRFGFGWPSPGYRVPPSTRTRERCYHYFGQRYCVGGETYGDRPAEGQTPQEPDFGTGPRLFDGH